MAGPIVLLPWTMNRRERLNAFVAVASETGRMLDLSHEVGLILNVERLPARAVNQVRNEGSREMFYVGWLREVLRATCRDNSHNLGITRIER